MSQVDKKPKFLKTKADIKIVVVGISASGKTSFCNRWIKQQMPTDYKATINPEFSYKVYEYKGNYYKIQLWDLGGQDRNIIASRVFTRGAHGCLVLYDGTSKETLINAKKWKDEINNTAKFVDGSTLPAILVKNKIDLIENNPEVDEELKQFSEENGFLTYTQTSCLQNINVDQTMEILITNIIDRLEEYQRSTCLNNEEKTSIVPERPTLKTQNLLQKQRFNCCI